MKGKGKTFLTVLLLLACVCCGMFVICEQTFAEADQNIDGAFYSRGLYACYNGGHMTKIINLEAKGKDDIFKDDDDVVGIPSFKNPDDLSCKELFEKLSFTYEVNPQTLKNLGYNPFSEFYYMGFDFGSFDQTMTPETSTSASGIGIIPAMVNQGARFEKGVTLGVRFNLDDDGKIESIGWSIPGEDCTNSLCRVNMNGNEYDALWTWTTNNGTLKMAQTSMKFGGIDTEDDDSDKALVLNVKAKGKTPSELGDALHREFESRFQRFEGELGDSVRDKDFSAGFDMIRESAISETSKGIYYIVNSSNNGKVTQVEDESTNIYKLDDDKDKAFRKAYKTIFKKDYKVEYQEVSQEQTVVLYQNYLTDVYQIELHNSCASSKDKAGEGAGLAVDDDDNNMKSWRLVKMFGADGNAQYCYARFDDENLAEKKVHGIAGIHLLWPAGSTVGIPMMAGERIGLNNILKWMMDFSPDKITAGAVEQYKTVDHANPDNSNNSNNPNEDDSGKVEPTCQNQGGAGALGWIVCSILDWMKEAAEDLYTNVVKPELTVEPALFQNGSSSSTLQPAAEAAWSTFRDIANIIFTIIVLFVIFSQLTGVGIDNYGIKKILPKLIVAAVLINLSYLICLICVDLSNIVGNGLQAFFNSFQILGEDNSGNYSGLGFGKDVGFVAVGIIAVVVTTVAIYKNPALLLVLFISVLGVLISVIFIFILLTGRKAAIVLLTVVSPVAFILYMLPNTKKIFDKWLNLWKAMLLVYPICGLLIGGGNFASKLMLVTVASSDNSASLFAALIVGIIPIFFIPTVIKSAYAAIGHIGGAIAGFGGRFRGGFDRRARGSQAFQRAQKSSQDRNQRISAMRRAGVKLDKDGNILESKRPTARLKRSLSGTPVGRRLGLQASMGQSFNEFAAMEATRRGRIAGSETDAMNAVFAGVAEKESAQRVSDHETLMRAGKVQIDGRNLNVNNAGDMQRYHKAMLEMAHQKGAAGDTAGYNAAMDKVKAAQNIMAKSDVGRGNIQANYAAAVGSGNSGGLEEAASHLLGAHGSDIKASNRAMHKLAQDLANGIKASDVKTNIDNNNYNIDSIGGYNAQTLAAADEKALKDLHDNIDAINNATNDRGEHEAREQLNALINEALTNPNIQPQEKIRKQLEDIRKGLQTNNGSNPIGFSTS